MVIVALVTGPYLLLVIDLRDPKLSAATDAANPLFGHFFECGAQFDARGCKLEKKIDDRRRRLTWISANAIR
jgi:hypothetical protein